MMSSRSLKVLSPRDAALGQPRLPEQARQLGDRVFDALRDRIIVLDCDGVVVKANRAALDAANGKPFVGMMCSMLGCSPSLEACPAMQAHARHEPVVGSCMQTDGESGRVFSVDAYPVPDLDGLGPLVIVHAHDITRRTQLEGLVRHQEKLAAVGLLAAGIAHDIANPLASMSSELEMLEDERDLDRVHGSLGVLRAQIGRITNTLREMTHFARRRGEETSIVRLDDAIDDALRMIRHDPRARRVAFTVDVGAALPRLRMVEDHLVMVLVNLFINALDAMPEGGRLEIRAGRGGGGVLLTVTDTGVGMTEEVRRRATEPLFTTKARGRGTGLGLSVSAEVLHEAGAHLSIASSPGCGTTVSITFGSDAVVADSTAQPAVAQA